MFVSVCGWITSALMHRLLFGRRRISTMVNDRQQRSSERSMSVTDRTPSTDKRPRPPPLAHNPFIPYTQVLGSHAACARAGGGRGCCGGGAVAWGTAAAARTTRRSSSAIAIIGYRIKRSTRSSIGSRSTSTFPTTDPAATTTARLGQQRRGQEGRRRVRACVGSLPPRFLLLSPRPVSSSADPNNIDSIPAAK